MSHRKSDLGIPCPRKICQSSARLGQLYADLGKETFKSYQDFAAKVIPIK